MQKLTFQAGHAAELGQLGPCQERERNEKNNIFDHFMAELVGRFAFFITKGVPSVKDLSISRFGCDAAYLHKIPEIEPKGFEKTFWAYL